MHRYSLIAAIVLLQCATYGFAETIYLKDGSVVQGEIFSENSYSVVVQTDALKKRYFRDQIDRIEIDEQGESMGLLSDSYYKFDGISGKKAKLIFDYIESSGVRNAMTKNIQQTVSQAPIEEREKYEKLFNLDEIIDLLIPVYDRYYSDEDLKEMIRFYDSSVGQKIIQSTPEIMKETLGVTINYIEEKTKE